MFLADLCIIFNSIIILFIFVFKKLYMKIIYELFGMLYGRICDHKFTNITSFKRKRRRKSYRDIYIKQQNELF